jgi:hypothetical protein
MQERAQKSMAIQSYAGAIEYICVSAVKGKTIGYMRNLCVEQARGEIIVHADDDDYSHPMRLAEQVALLQSSDSECVGYRECAFWDTRLEVGKRKAQAFVRGDGPCIGVSAPLPGEAWVYRSPDPRYAIGASLMYWRKTWERVPFPDKNVGEDQHFTMRVKTVGVSGLRFPDIADSVGAPCEPRLICGIHGSNSADYRKFSKQSWRREPALDEICRTRMAL